MDKSVYYDAEGILNKSLLVWIKTPTMSLKDSIRYLLESYRKTGAEIDYYVKNIEQTIDDWNVFIDSTGMRLAYKPVKLSSAKRFTIKDIYDQTVVDAKKKDII